MTNPDTLDSTQTCDAVASTDDIAPARSQLSLQALFLCVTYFSVASLCALQWGVGVFVAATGVFLTWLGYRGYLWWLQTKQNRSRAFIVAWMLFGVSLALPAATVPGCGSSPPTTNRGWELVANGVMYGMAVADDARECVVDPPSRSLERIRDTQLGLINVVLVNLPNVMMLLSPWLLYRQQRVDRGHWSPIWGCAAVSTWTWAITQGWDMLLGYYLWMSAVLLIFLSRPVRWQTLFAMGIVGLICLCLHIAS
jgi:hypothetical protein